MIKNRMNNKFLGISILAVLVSFAGGFLLANALNRNEIANLTAENTRIQKTQNGEQKKVSEINLSDEEINKKLAEAKANPKDFAFQKGLGLGLYRYAALKQDVRLLEEVSVLLDRAYQINSDDYEVIVSLGNILFDLGQIKKDSNSNLKAREFYAKALKKNEKDTNVITDFAMTYLLTESPDLEKAITEFEKALAVDPKNEKALFYMTQAQVENENLADAGKYLAILKEVNPKNERISELETMISQKNK